MYLLDTSVFVEAANRYYRFEIAPGFWNALLDQARIGKVGSIDKVLAELLRMNDPLADWARSKFAHAFASTRQSRVRQEYRRVIQFVSRQTRYTDQARRQFADADNADAWLVAFALAHGGTVVTQETPAPQSKRVVKIPDVCQHFNIRWVDTFAMMSELGIRLH
jgi:predicted nucleic acid-binding protein